MKLIDGKAIAAEIRAELKARTQAFEETYGKKIGLAGRTHRERPRFAGVRPQ